MYNGKVMRMIGSSLQRSEGAFYKLLGKKMTRWNTRIERKTTIKKNSFSYKVNKYFKDIILNLDLAKDNVTPVGLLTFITTLAVGVTVLFVLFTGDFLLAVFAFFAIFYFIVVLFRFISLSMYEKKEAEIMDTEDLLAMDIKGGVQNAIQRYIKSLHPNMKPYFEEFLDNIKHKGYGFRQAMLLLNDKLGPNFSDFAQKAIIYEEKADNDLDDIFSSIVERNRFKRQLRYRNNQKFNQLRLEFLLSVAIIGGYVVFSVFSDPFLSTFFRDSFFGKVLLIGDVVIVTAVLGYISSIKAKFI